MLTRKRPWWWNYNINPEDYTEEELEELGYQIGDNERDAWLDRKDEEG